MNLLFGQKSEFWPTFRNSWSRFLCQHETSYTSTMAERGSRKIKKAAERKAKEKLWRPVHETKFSHDHPGVCLHLDCFPSTRSPAKTMVSDFTLQ